MIIITISKCTKTEFPQQFCELKFGIPDIQSSRNHLKGALNAIEIVDVNEYSGTLELDYSSVTTNNG